jgi:2-polyprenyl-3-methyl-5-hydroxy-6-metoxy-1,4-benzoquinol methylase
MKRMVIDFLLAFGLLPQALNARLVAATLSPKSLARNLRFRLGRNREMLPIPRPWPRLMVAGSTDVPGFLESGRRGFDCIRETLEKNGTPLSSLTDILDFGCGCGRVLRHWEGQPDKRIYGTDMNDDLVKEAQRCVPFASISKNSLVGKVAYADRSFDLVYAFSVLTHLDVDAQGAWLAEFRRILRPGGVLLLSLHGEAYRGRLSKTELEAFNSGRPVVRRSQYAGGNLCSSFHPESYVRASMTEGFQIVDVVLQGAKGNPPQDLYMLRRVD